MAWKCGWSFPSGNLLCCVKVLHFTKSRQKIVRRKRIFVCMCLCVYVCSSGMSSSGFRVGGGGEARLKRGAL